MNPCANLRPTPVALVTMNDLFMLMPFFSALSIKRFLCAVLCLCAVSGALAQKKSVPKNTLNGDYIVAVVDSFPITNHEVRSRANQIRLELVTKNGTAPSADFLLKDALEKLIEEKALLQNAKDTGVDVDLLAVEQSEIRKAALAQMSVEQWRKSAMSEGKTLAEVQQGLREQLTLQKLTERNVPARIKISDKEIDEAVKAQQGANSSPNVELELAQILVAVPESASDSQVLALQNKARIILSRLKQGEDFLAVALKSSDSPDREKGGNLGLRPADKYPSLFVNATQNLGVGELSDVVRSGAGFHILKVINKRSSNKVAITETHARHILLRIDSKLSLIEAGGKLAEFRKQILAGKANFAQLARDYSSDASAPAGGDLGWVGPGNFVPEFEKVMDALAVDEISDPLVSRFGVHLIQVLERRQGVMSERDFRELMRNNLRDKKYEETYSQWVQEVRGHAYVEYRDPPQ